MRTDEIVETLISQYDLDGIRVINNSTSSSIDPYDTYDTYDTYESLAIELGN